MKFINNIAKNIDNKSTILLIILLILIICFFINRKLLNLNKENFSYNGNHFILKKNQNIYDDFYVNIYDKLTYDKIRNDFEIGSIVNNTYPNKNSYILDIGSGTGHIVGELNNIGYNTIGIDTSISMIRKSRENYPNCKFYNNNVLKTINFNKSTFTHINCLYFTIYHIKNKDLFFNNCIYWLIPGGYIILHLVNNETFDTLLPINNDLLTYPRKYLDNRLTTNKATIDNYDYKSIIVNKYNKTIFNEKFKNRTDNNVINNELELYMDKPNNILNIAKNKGFIVINKSKLTNYKDQYIYILQKPL
jgi:SAM-dependent methyltransferase